jgi:hypothetical protein
VLSQLFFVSPLVATVESRQLDRCCERKAPVSVTLQAGAKARWMGPTPNFELQRYEVHDKRKEST